MSTRPRVVSEEQYLSECGGVELGEAGLHKSNSRLSPKQWKRMVDKQAHKDINVVARREALRQEYRVKCSSGELRPPTRLERLEMTAAGYPDNPAVQAARRILADMDNLRLTSPKQTS